jgi:tRNA-2-methylthio-N6-dimethylallyladenosine synthase
MKHYFIETFGCQMNKSDSEIMRFSLDKAGFAPSDKEEKADILIFNTCSVRQHAEERAIARMNAVRKTVRRSGGFIVLAGCMAQRIGTELLANGIADLVIGPYQSPRIGEIVKKHIDVDEENSVYLSQQREDFEERIYRELAFRSEEQPWHKWVTITHGCDNFCSYCIVPSVRGQLISFPSNRIIDYIKVIAENGITEITLLGQNVNQYGTDTGDIPFYRLLEKIAQIDSLIRINFIASHPKDFIPEIVEVIRDYQNISRSIHLPLQSGSNRILSLMNRKYTLEQYLSIINHIENLLPEHALSTDIIVGFPGETEEEFHQTLKAVERIRFDDAFMYAYSPREGTSAYALEESLMHEEKIERLNRLISMQRRISAEKLHSRKDRIEEIIIERVSKKSSREVMGRTFLNHPVITPGREDEIGEKIPVKIREVRGSTLFGTRAYHHSPVPPVTPTPTAK